MIVKIKMKLLLKLSICLTFLQHVFMEDGSCSKDGDDCGANKENKYKKTVLVTGGSGFVAHHVMVRGFIQHFAKVQSGMFYCARRSKF